MTERDPKLLAQSWLTVQRHWWAYQALLDLGRSNPQEALTAILALVELAGTPELLERVGAGPLEDLLEYHGAAVIDEVESRAQTDSALRAALSHVWLTEGVGSSSIGNRLLSLGCRVVPTR